MKNIIYDLKDMSDSREVLESRPNRFITIFIYGVVLFLAIAIIWAVFGKIDVVVKANGVVRPNEKISTIKNIVSGKVGQVSIENGQRVTRGDILYTVDYTDFRLKKQFLETEIDRKERVVVANEKLVQSIEDEKNYLDENDKIENEYYRKYLKNITDMETEVVVAQQLLEEQKNLMEKIKDMNTLVTSLETGKNIFLESGKVDNIQQIAYRDYEVKRKKLQQINNQNEKNYEIQKKLYEAGATPQIEYEKAKYKMDEGTLELARYENETLLSIKSDIDKNTVALNVLNGNVKKLVPHIAGTGRSVEEALKEQLKNNQIIILNNTLDNERTALKNMKNDLEDVERNIEKCMVKAPIDGYINMVREINQGDILESQSTIATIIPEDDSNYIVQIYAPNGEIINIREGDTVRYHFMALPYKEYGELTGNITKIAIDTQLMNEGNTSVYLVEANVQNKPLFGYDGESVDIKVGMVCEARIISKTKTIMNYILEKMDFKS